MAVFLFLPTNHGRNLNTVAVSVSKCLLKLQVKNYRYRKCTEDQGFAWGSGCPVSNQCAKWFLVELEGCYKLLLAKGSP